MQLNTYAVSVSVFIVIELMRAAWILKFHTVGYAGTVCSATY